MGYVKQAEDPTGDLGTPFAPLPAALIDGSARAIATVGANECIGDGVALASEHERGDAEGCAHAAIVCPGDGKDAVAVAAAHLVGAGLATGQASGRNDADEAEISRRDPRERSATTGAHVELARRSDGGAVDHDTTRGHAETIAPGVDSVNAASCDR